MILFRIDGVYRLQAYVFGKGTEPPKPSKVCRHPLKGYIPLCLQSLQAHSCIFLFLFEFSSREKDSEIVE